MRLIAGPRIRRLSLRITGIRLVKIMTICTMIQYLIMSFLFLFVLTSHFIDCIGKLVSTDLNLFQRSGKTTRIPPKELCR